MKVYIYDSKTFEFIREHNCQPDPLNLNCWLLPNSCTEKQPLKEIEGQRLYFNKEKNKWVYEKIVEEVRQRKISETKKEKMLDLKFFIEDTIYSEYPVHKQLNISNGIDYDEAEFDKMKDFINKHRELYHKYEEEINKTDSLKKIDEIIFKTED